MGKVLISGITGFLGSHIAENLIEANFQIIGLKRKNSNLWRCAEFKEMVEWVDIDDEGSYKKTLGKFTIDVFIHGAWIGVKSEQRNDQALQAHNVKFLDSLLHVASASQVKKIILLGSQAEYGKINEIVTEDDECNAITAYGKAKLACLDLIENFSKSHKIDWLWLRLFSLFGEREDKTWLIPSLIQKMKAENEMDFTLADQKYAYLYVKDFANIIHQLITLPIESGIYNISSSNTMKIRELVEKIRDKINQTFLLKFGALEYRENQSMHVEGSMIKLIAQIGDIKFTDFDVAITNTIKYYNQ
jgi:UDP-glucose 4-epimerase